MDLDFIILSYRQVVTLVSKLHLIGTTSDPAVFAQTAVLRATDWQVPVLTPLAEGIAQIFSERRLNDIDLRQWQEVQRYIGEEFESKLWKCQSPATMVSVGGLLNDSNLRSLDIMIDSTFKHLCRSLVLKLIQSAIMTCTWMFSATNKELRCVLSMDGISLTIEVVEVYMSCHKK